MKRREFFRVAGAAAALAAVGCGGRSGESDSMSSTGGEAAGMRGVGLFGIQLYTLRSLMRNSVPDTLAMVADAGYGEVEFAGYFDHAPADVRTMLDDLGLASPSTHVSLEQLEADAAGQFEIARTLGQHHVVVPFLAPPLRQNLDGYRSVAERLNVLGEQAQAAGLQLAYHNHDFEFEMLDGGMPFDVLLQETDSGLVKMQLDLFWIFVGGQSAVEYLSADPARYVSCHVKDGSRDPVAQTIVGQGSVDFESAFAAADFQHYFVENDQPEDPEAFARQSAAHLASMTF